MDAVYRDGNVRHEPASVIHAAPGAAACCTGRGTNVGTKHHGGGLEQARRLLTPLLYTQMFWRIEMMSACAVADHCGPPVRCR